MRIVCFSYDINLFILKSKSNCLTQIPWQSEFNKLTQHVFHYQLFFSLCEPMKGKTQFVFPYNLYKVYCWDNRIISKWKGKFTLRVTRGKLLVRESSTSTCGNGDKTAASTLQRGIFKHHFLFHVCLGFGFQWCIYSLFSQLWESCVLWKNSSVTRFYKDSLSISLQ